MATLTLVKKTSFTVASLATTMLLSICTPVRAFMFGTSGIKFNKNTDVNFKFQKSNSSNQSRLLVAEALPENIGYNNVAILFKEKTKPSDNGSANNWEGTFGNAVTSENGSRTQTVTFREKETYALLLWSHTGTDQQAEKYVSSSTFMNSIDWFPPDSEFRRDDCPVEGCQQAVFGDVNLNYDAKDSSFSTANGGKGPEQFQSVTMPELAEGTTIAFDDGQGGNDGDFKAFTVTAQLVPEPVPEPVTVFGTMVGIGALAAARRKKKRGQ